MTTVKTLIFAGFAALSLGTAMAQEGGTSTMPMSNDYWIQHQRAVIASQAPAKDANPVQAGSSDVSKPRSWFDSGWIGDNSPYRFQYGTLGGGGNG
jgi:hypothetical protein